MPIGWMTALKMVPWSDVIENAPTLVSGARKLFAKTRSDPPTPVPAADPAPLDAAQKEPRDTDPRITALTTALDHSQARIATLEAESRDTAAIITSLAEQQQQVVKAIDVLRKRTQTLIATTAILALACIGLLIAWAAR